MNRLFSAEIIRNESVDDRHFILELSPGAAVADTLVGQFFMLKPGESIDPLLLRPFSLMGFTVPGATHPNGTLSFLIRAAGKGTNILKRLPVGTCLTVLGPLGQGFPPIEEGERLIVVAGGIGIASVLGLVKVYQDVPLFYGVRTKGHLLLSPGMLNAISAEIHIASDDGSIGTKGNILELLEAYVFQLRKSFGGNIKIYACGPHAMLRAMAEMSLDAETYISLETPMACGLGTCLGCAVKTAGGIQMVCKDGPVFNIKDITWDEA
ncbi:MAG: dihydroorotate dehydrogenase electron transfer subunit [Nitrospirae bacterium]|nr:dihydroorotate dehydrogenase electron transfer subunit [Nitrospirota bacterium]